MGAELLTWEQNYSSFIELIGHELEPLGFRRVLKIKAPVVYWYRKDGSSVYLEPGRAQAANAAKPEVEPEPGWVTVSVGNRAPNSWLTKLRVLFFSEKGS